MFDNLKMLKRIGLISIVLGIIMPVVINFAYFSGQSCAIITTMWDASDMLQYFGTLLGAAATITAVVLTINHSEKINQRNVGIPVCLSFVDACDFNKVYMIIMDNHMKYSEYDHNDLFNAVSIELGNVMDSIKKCKFELYFIYPSFTKSTKEFIDKFVDEYINILFELIESVIEPNDGVNTELLKNKKNEYKQSYDKVCKLLRDEVFGYDL